MATMAEARLRTLFDVLDDQEDKGPVTVKPVKVVDRIERPVTAPYVKGSATSQAAAESMRERAPSLRGQVLTFLRQRGDRGATVDEVEATLGLLHQTAGARMRELVQNGWAIDSGHHRLTRSGRKAVVWLASDGGEMGEAGWEGSR